MDVERAIKEIQDALIVMAEIEKRQSALLREAAEALGKHDDRFAVLDEFRPRADLKLRELEDKLDGLIGYVGGLRPPPV